METIAHILRNYKSLVIVYFLMLLLSFHYYFLLYINSSYVSGILDPYIGAAAAEKTISILYALGAIANIYILLKASRILRKFGNYIVMMTAVILEFTAIAGMALFPHPAIALPFFVLHQAVIPLILFSLDAFLEGFSPGENKKGEVRGIFLTVSNTALVISPFVIGIITGLGGYKMAYLSSLIFLVVFYFVSRKSFRSYIDAPYEDIKSLTTVRNIWNNKDIRSVYIAHAIMQFFYAWMVVYTPIYLHDHIGLTWPEIGVIFSVMLIPFVILQLPAGTLADRAWGEKELMIAGFIIISGATLFLAIPEAPNILIWTMILFLTRVGASLTEITTETYFFKHIRPEQSDLISFFRITRPLSFITAPIVVALLLLIMPLKLTFIVLSGIVLIGALFATRITDTR